MCNPVVLVEGILSSPVEATLLHLRNVVILKLNMEDVAHAEEGKALFSVFEIWYCLKQKVLKCYIGSFLRPTDDVFLNPRVSSP